MKCNYNGCSSKCKCDIDVESCNVLRAYQQGKENGAREFAEWMYGKNFIFCARTKHERINMLLAEWKKGE